MAAMNYTCTVCGPDVAHPKSELTVKRAQFRVSGKNGAVIKTRAIAWLCHDHLEADPHWNLPAFSTAPGTVAKRITVEIQ